MSGSAGHAIRHAAFYGAVFVALGVFLPFWPVWLGSRGIAPEQIGLLFALASWIRIVSSPAIGNLADRAAQPRLVFALLAGLAAVFFAALYPLSGFWAILALSLAASIGLGALLPLAESQTITAALRGDFDYGRVRLWGSLAFVVSTVGVGGLLHGRHPDLILACVVMAMFAAVITALCLPRRGVPVPTGRSGRILPLLTDRRFLLFLAAASLLQASHATYYGFSALYWRTAGLSTTLIGWYWAEGVIAEVVFFAVSSAILARTSPAALLIAAGIAGMVRWVVLGLTTDFAAVALVQILHAATFGAAHLGAMHLITRATPPGLAATAQGIYAAASGGIGLGLALLIAGLLYAASPPSAFIAMAALSAGGTGLAVLLRRRMRAAGSIGEVG